MAATTVEIICLSSSSDSDDEESKRKRFRSSNCDSTEHNTTSTTQCESPQVKVERLQRSFEFADFDTNDECNVTHCESPQVTIESLHRSFEFADFDTNDECNVTHCESPQVTIESLHRSFEFADSDTNDECNVTHCESPQVTIESLHRSFEFADSDTNDDGDDLAMQCKSPKIKFECDSVDLRESPLKQYPNLQSFNIGTIIPLLLNLEGNEKFIRTTILKGSRKSQWYVIRLSALKHPDDILSDDLGAWKSNGTHCYSYRVQRSDNGSFVSMERLSEKKGNCEINCRYYKCASETDFRKTIWKVVLSSFGVEWESYPYAFIRYYYDSGIKEKQFDIRPHQNRRSRCVTMPYIRTAASTKETIREGNQKLPTKRKLFEIVQKTGSIETIESPSLIPRNERQVMYELSKNKVKSIDPLFSVINAQLENDFIQEVAFTHSDGFRIILSTKQQLDEIGKFCTRGNKHYCSILSTDVTFNLGKFLLFVTAYRNPFLLQRHNVAPVQLGPVMIFQVKSEKSYLAFLDYLCREIPALRDNIISVGSDNEMALVNALRQTFPKAIGLVCSLHQRKNIREKLRKLGIPANEAESIITDIFSADTGLIYSSNSSQFHSMLAALKTKWNETFDSEKIGSFIVYFDKFKKITLEMNSSLMAVQDSELGNKPFVNNDAEVINSCLKGWQNFEKKDIDEFITDIQNFIKCNFEEMKKALLQMSEKWKVKQEFSSMQGNIGMKQEDRIKVFEKFRNFQFLNEDKTSQKRDVTNLNNLSTNEQLLTAFSERELCQISSKAQQLLQHAKVMTGFDKNTFFVKSTSDSRPHCCKISPKFFCTCVGFNANKLCSHIVGTAEYTKQMDKLVKQATVSSRSLTKLAYTKISNKCGEKGVIGRKTSLKAVASATSTTPTTSEKTDENAFNADEPGLFVSRCTPRTIRISRPIETSNCVNNGVYTVRKIAGNISKCAGCKKKLQLHPLGFSQELDNEYCLARFEKYSFFINNELQSTKGNRHYHINPICADDLEAINGSEILAFEKLLAITRRFPNAKVL